MRGASTLKASARAISGREVSTVNILGVTTENGAAVVEYEVRGLSLGSTLFDVTVEVRLRTPNESVVGSTEATHGLSEDGQRFTDEVSYSLPGDESEEVEIVVEIEDEEGNTADDATYETLSQPPADSGGDDNGDTTNGGDNGDTTDPENGDQSTDSGIGVRELAIAGAIGAGAYVLSNR